MIEMNEVDEKVKKGWIDVSMTFEVLGTSEGIVKDSLKKHIEKISSDERAKLYKQNLFEIQEVENPVKNVKKGFSQFCELNLIVKNMDNLVQLVIEYGPSSIEILRPNKLEIDIGEAQNILNSIANMMHTFAAAGLGGIIISRG